MKQGIGVFDVWVFRRDRDAVRYLLLHTSQEKADRWFNGGRFWQIPSDFVSDGEPLVNAVSRCLAGYGIEPTSIWAVDHAYTIYNRRYDEIQPVLVLAAEVAGNKDIRLTWEHAEYRWCTASDCEKLLGFRGLLEGLSWTRRYVTEAEVLLPELKLY
jgi:hypothetical protein